MIRIVQGGHYGSEGKGAVVGAIALRFGADYAVRSGGINAGHTVVHGGIPCAMRLLPCAWVNLNCKLVLAPGALIHAPTLHVDVRTVARALGQSEDAVRSRIYIDHRAGLHLDQHRDAATRADRHHKRGTTGKGVSEAIAWRLQDRGAHKLFASTEDARAYNIVDTVAMINNAADSRKEIILETTQGILLDLYCGPYPHTTARPTGPASWLADAGLSPRLPMEVWLVWRSYPIRVAGNSGPLPREMSWAALARRINARLVTHGHKPLVGEEILQVWERACQQQAEEIRASEHPIPDDPRTAAHPEEWSPDERERCAWTASELHAGALRQLPTTHQTELKRLFEFTTVTRKLRRIAEFDVASGLAALTQARPDHVVVTFCDYWVPEAADSCSVPPDLKDKLAHIEADTNARIRWVSLGPAPNHQLLPT